MTEEFDLLVLGAGSAGYSAARVASTQLRSRVGIVDKGPLGGLCILAGCMPSKALIQTAHVADLIRKAATFGLDATLNGVDFPAVQARKQCFVDEFAMDRAEGLQALPNTELILGEASFVDANTVKVGDRLVTAPKIILAVGSAPLQPAVPGLREIGYLDSDSALVLKQLPSSLAIIGGGIIAMELGQFFARMGVHVTLLEVSPRLLSREDPDVADVITECMRRDGLIVRTQVKVIEARKEGTQKALKLLHVDDGEEWIQAEEILVAIGREPNVRELGLERVGVQMQGRRLVLDRCLYTTNPNILAAGDVTGGSYLVHVAVAEGELAARNALLGCTPALIPEYLYISAAFTDPNIARVGLSEEQARALGREVLVGRYQFREHGKAEILDATEGFVKMLADPRTGEILGVTIVGHDGAELIHVASCAITLRATVEQFLAIPHVHPTMAEILTYPAEQILEQMRTRLLPTALYPAGYNDQEECDYEIEYRDII